MKRIIIALYCILLTVSYADAALRLLRVKGNVMVKELDETHPAATREIVRNSTVLIIPQDASVAVLDEGTRAVYYSPKEGGTLTVGNIVKRARREAEKTTSAIARQALASLDGSNGGGARKGVSYRGDDPTGKIETEIADIILSRSAAGSCPISVGMVENSDSTCHFVINNLSDKPVYMSVVVWTPESYPQLLFPVSNAAYTPCILAPPGETELAPYSFFGLQKDYLHIITSPSPFDTGMVNILLRRNEISGNTFENQSMTFTPINATVK